MVRATGDETGRESRGGRRRRSVLAALGTAGAAGVLGTAARVGSQDHAVSILAAGSLQRTLDQGLGDALDVPIRVEAHGSVTAARLVANGHREPDVVVLADETLFDTILSAPWHATIATNELVVGHTPQPDPHPITTTSPWFRPVLEGAVSLGRTDPELDPLGYRTAFAFDLGEAVYEWPDLREELLTASDVYPETSLVSHFESGALDAAVLYRNMAFERDYPSLDLPRTVDLGDPAGDYGEARYRLDDGTVLRGGPIRYGAWARRTREPVRQVFEELAEGTVLEAHGFGSPRSLPAYHGSPPDVVSE